MKYRRLGKSDIYCSLIGYGGWKAGRFGWSKVDDKKTLYAIEFAIDNGINFFDTAPIYGMGHSEILFGKVLQKKRDKVYIATKVGLILDKIEKVKKSLKKENIIKEIDDSLQRLQTSYIDLIQVHWKDNKTPVNEYMEAFLYAKNQGKIRNIGLCNCDLKSIIEARKYSEIASIQSLYNILEKNPDSFYTEKLEYKTEDEILPFCKKNDIGFIPYCPLAQGFLSEDFDINNLSLSDMRIKNSSFTKMLDKKHDLAELARSQNISLIQLAILWLAKKKEISTIIISTIKPEHILFNIKTLDLLDEVSQM